MGVSFRDHSHPSSYAFIDHGIYHSVGDEFETRIGFLQGGIKGELRGREIMNRIELILFSADCSESLEYIRQKEEVSY